MRRLSAGQFLFMASMVVLAFTTSASSLLAVQTNFANKPAAFSGNDDVFWDTEFAALIANIPGQKVFILDFCHSGGFVDNLAGAGTYIATAADWDEYSFGCVRDIAPFGQTFMNESKTNTLHDSFIDAEGQVIARSTPQESQGGLGGTTLDYVVGDRAIIFSAGNRFGGSIIIDDPDDVDNDNIFAEQHHDFWTDLKTAHDSLTTRAANPWPEAAIEVMWDHGQGAPPGPPGIDNSGAPFVDFTAAKNNMTITLQRFATGGAEEMDPDNKLFIYINDHGVSTDTARSKHAGTRYDYRVNTSLHRATDPDVVGEPEDDYGITQFYVRTQDPTLANYTNWTEPAGWDHELVRRKGLGWVIRFFAINANDESTFLVSGQDYDFGFDHNNDPLKVFWATLSGCEMCGTTQINDFGFPDGTPWGSGAWVYGVSPINGQVDPAQWPGWANGGDGWVLAPVPEPSSLMLVVIAVVGLLAQRRRSNIDT